MDLKRENMFKCFFFFLQHPKMTHMKKLRVDLSRLFLVTSACPGQMTGSGSLQQSFPLQMQVNKLHGRAVTCGNQTVTASVFMQNISFSETDQKATVGDIRALLVTTIHAKSCTVIKLAGPRPRLIQWGMEGIIQPRSTKKFTEHPTKHEPSYLQLVMWHTNVTSIFN